MPSIISVIAKHRGQAGDSNGQFPAPAGWRTHIEMTVDTGGLLMFEHADRGVGFTGVFNISTGLFSLAAVETRDYNVDYDIGGFKRGPNKITHSGETAIGPQTVAFNRGNMPSGKAMELLGAKPIVPIFHDCKNPKTGINEGTSHEQLAKDSVNIPRSVGKGVNIPMAENFLGFTITKQEGTQAWPHEIIFRSGTFNKNKFGNAGRDIPTDWVNLMVNALQIFLPTCNVQTRARR